MDEDDIQQTKRCVSCGGNYRLVFFRPRAKTNGNPYSALEPQLYRDRCIGCEATIKPEDLTRRRLRKNALGTRRRHGAKLKELGIIEDADALQEIYGWSLDRMIDDIRHVIDEGCPYCFQPAKVDEKGLGVVTIDILNPERKPHYSTNIRWCCARCNSEKQRISPDTWGERRSMWDLWHRHQTRLKADPEVFGFLAFENGPEPPPTLW